LARNASFDYFWTFFRLAKMPARHHRRQKIKFSKKTLKIPLFFDGIFYFLKFALKKI